MKKGAKILVMLLIALVMVSANNGEIIFVDADATGANNGSSWADAYNDLQDALAVAQSGDEIRVAQGVYKPDQGAGVVSDDRDTTFQLINGVTLKGGYAGFGETEPNARDIDVYETILSGDLDGDDEPNFTNTGDNTWHVVTSIGANETAILDGFTVTAGYAYEDHANGGGMYNKNGSPKVTNCTFKENYAGYKGGGMYNDGGSPRVTNCTFNSNKSGYGGGISNDNSSCTITMCTFIGNAAMLGGGIWNYESALVLTDCTFIENSAKYGGGGVDNSAISPRLTNCSFIGNLAEYGGGMNSSGPGTILTDCTFTSNSAERDGGGIRIYSSDMSTLTNCAFNGNLAVNGGGIHNSGDAKLNSCLFSGNRADFGGGMYIDSSNSQITNCTFAGNLASYGRTFACDCSRWKCSSNIAVTNSILWNGGNEIWNNDGSTISITYSDVQGGWNGEGNINADPCFVQSGYLDPSLPPPPIPPLPLFKASEPNPADGAMTVNVTADLSWTPGYNAISHDVYFGISYPPPFISNQTSTTFDPGTMAYSTTYYWHIDEVDDSGVTAGDVWSFSTIMPPPPGMSLSISAASSMSDNPQYFWIEGDYNLLSISPCKDAGDPNYVPGVNETDLDGNPRIMGNRIDMGAYEPIPPIPAEVRISPSTINPESKGQWITASIRLPKDYDVADIDTNSILLEYSIEPQEFWINELKQAVMANFNREEVQGILKAGEVELTVSVQLTDGTLFDGSDIIKVGSRGHADNFQASVPNVTGVSITADLSWTAGTYATSHDVYFGTSNPPPFICNQTAPMFDPSMMDYQSTYYWRIDEVSKWGVTAGQLSSFTTIEAPPLPPPLPPGPPPPPPPPPPP